MATMATMAKPVMVIGVDNSEGGIHALEWTLDHLFSSTWHPFQLIIVHAKPIIPAFFDISDPVLGSARNQYMDEELKEVAARVINSAKEICAAKSVHDAVFEIVSGDARYMLCEAVERHHASTLVVGSHGYGAIKRAFLGSVSDYCAHQAPCTVMIVKKPKISSTV